MALNDFVNLSELGASDVASTGPGNPVSDSILTGDLRRKYNFGDRVSELAISQDPFFRFVSKISKKPTDDPQFKFTEKRQSYHKRYAYVGAVNLSSSGWVTTSDAGAVITADDSIKLRMITDYKNSGNIQNVFGNTANDFQIGVADSMPKFFLQDQIVKIPCAASAGGDVSDYALVKVNSVTEYSANGSANDATIIATNNPDMVELSCTVVKTGTQYLAVTANIDDGGSTVTQATQRIHDQLEPMRSYVVGSAHAEGSGYPETWKDQPYSTNYGRTQIWKTAMAMTNTARATSLKY